MEERRDICPRPPPTSGTCAALSQIHQADPGQGETSSGCLGPLPAITPSHMPQVTHVFPPGWAGRWGQLEHPYLSAHTLQHPWGSPLPYQVFFLSPKPTGSGQWKCFQSHQCRNEGWQFGDSGLVLHREKNTGSQGQARAWQRQCFTGNSDAGMQRWRMSQEDRPAPPHARVQHPGSAARQAGLGSQLWCLGTWGKSQSSIGLFPHLQNGRQKHLCQLGLW